MVNEDLPPSSKIWKILTRNMIPNNGNNVQCLQFDISLPWFQCVQILLNNVQATAVGQDSPPPQAFH